MTGPDRYWGPFRAWRDGLDPPPEEASFYHGVFARAYDRTTFSDQAGAAEYLRLAEACQGTVLETFCGSGRILLRLAYHGHDIVGVDNSPDMLTLLKARLDQLPEDIRGRVAYECADVRDLDLGRTFSLVLATINSLALLDAPSDRLAFFHSVRRHVHDDGVLAFDYLRIPDGAVDALDGRVRTVTEHVGERTIVSTFGLRFDEARRSAVFNIHSEHLRPGAPPRRYLGAFTAARLDDLELEDELARAGFVVFERAEGPDDLLGASVTRCLLQARPRLPRSYPLWHPHQPRSEDSEHVTVLVEGQGTRVRDREGNSYLDASGGLWSTQCGLGRRDIVDAVTAQLEKLSYGTLFASRSNEPAIELSRRLVELTPPALTHAYLTCSGSESVEVAIKLARLSFSLRGQPERHGIAYLDRSYHGSFYGSMGVTALFPAKERLGPHVPGLVALPSPPDASEPADQDDPGNAAEVEAAVAEAAGSLAALVLEPVLGSAGCVVPSRAWLDRVQRACRRHDVLLVVDEVATGFGRTGRWFACDLFDLRPDVLLLSKGISSGYLPLGAVMFSERIGETLTRAGSGIGHGSSANGNPACCAAGIATIDALEREHLVERAAEVGAYLGERLRELAASEPAVRQVRGVGLMRSVELDVDPPAGQRGDVRVVETLQHMQRSGVLAYPFARGVSFLPALTVTTGELDVMVDRLARAASEVFR